MLKLSDYQVPAKDWLYENTFACLWDSPGVGKTAPAIVAAYQKSQDTQLPVLVTCPAYLCENWRWEISRFTPPGTRVEVANGSGPAARHASLQADADFIVHSYANWSARKGGLYTYPELATREWAACVFDEGHRLRGRNANCTKHVLSMRKVACPNHSTPVWSLTGTPMPNNPGDIFPMLHLWRPREFRSYWNYVGEYCRIVKTPWATEVGQLRRGMEQDFQELVGQFAMRRTLADVPSLSELEQRDRDYKVKLPASVRKTMDKARLEYIIEHPDLEASEFVSGGGALYSRLRQMATVPPTREKPKVDFVLDFLEDRQGPVVVYVWYKDSAKGVAEALSKSKRPVTLITGDVPSHKRGGMAEAWSKQSDGVLVATISSLKEGISLVAAQDVVFLEHSELPSDQEQCVARLKRRGQTALVNVHHVWAEDSPDMAIKKAVGKREMGLKAALITWLQTGKI